MDYFKAEKWGDYELLDCGNGAKLERFGNVVLIRPEPNARNRPTGPLSSWRNEAHAEFISTEKNRGHWKILKKIPSDWNISWGSTDCPIRLHLDLTSFKHVGLFPEQSSNWKIIQNFIRKSTQPVRVLNLFAYTGAASLAAKACGADVVHVDSVRQIVTWARRNMELSGLSDIRWVIEDALTFASKEVKRQRVYDVLIMDPPAFGIGAKGERWRIEDQIESLLSTGIQLLNPNHHLMIVNTYTPTIDPEALNRFFFQACQGKLKAKSAELVNQSSSGHILPHGSTLRTVKY